ncbi:alpha-mannosidase [Gloeocapsa sp. PCC 73106]|uniref:alpha-mannosidase n=1 Tax=Gloeocapsa sp. PCC 73106 TaxID=102232 RepID=UPI0002ACDCB9|nr:alpha-mannosidase [Gloeocapsa sp. PCC 73106]ELR96555.1 alpha-mannosidase [Gloeocapsa sp. PCC 73106]
MEHVPFIEATVAQLRQLTHFPLQERWYGCSQGSNWQMTTPNPQGYLTWSSGGKVQWFSQTLTTPTELQGYSMRLQLTWWAQSAQVYLDGKLVREGDLFDSSTRLLLTESAIAGESRAIALRLVSPGHDIGALMQSQCIYEKDQDPGFVADQLAILSQYLQKFAPQDLPILANHLERINWSLSPEDFEAHLQQICTDLLPLGTGLKEHQISLLGHAHLDLAWLWTITETWQVAKNTFASVLSLQQRFSELTFAHSTPVIYEWIEQHHPDLFAAIQQKIQQGKWEVVGGMWVEPEVNLIGGESLVRQLLYGQRYCQEKFGRITQIAWLPDSFGFPRQLPQILQQAGINYFVTGKLHWNDTTKFPYGLFNWSALDGSSVVASMLPQNLAGVMDTNPLSMTNHAFAWREQTGLTHAFWLPGVGDHGGGPTQEMLEVLQRWSQSAVFCPRLQFTTALDYLQQLPQDNLPVWDDELYLEFHRGCYTTKGDQKKLNRYAEGLLYEAEMFGAIASVLGESQYPAKQITSAWQEVLCNQFHDILPGTSIPEVFVEAQQRWTSAIALGEKILKDSLDTIIAQINLPPVPYPGAQPLVIFNSLNWCREEVVSISTPPGDWGICDLEGRILVTQRSCELELLFFASNVPSVGYRLFWLYPLESEVKPVFREPPDYILDNGLLRVVICPKTGDILSIFDLKSQLELLKAPANQLQSFQDQGQYWDAWNIDPNYQAHSLELTQLQEIQSLETGPLRWRVRVVRQMRKSLWEQDYLLNLNSPVLRILTRVDWQETHTLVKAAFPLVLESDRVSYETACGVVNRPTQPQNLAEAAKWEVSALDWACLVDSRQNYSFSLLSDCKHGYDSQPSQLRLTLLRSPTWPDPQADRGKQEFTYAIYPHPGTWQQAEVTRRGAELNLPLKIDYLHPVQGKKRLPPTTSFLQLGAENLRLMALKGGETGDWILRCYEYQGETAELNFQNNLGLVIIKRVNVLEETIKIEAIASIQPWQIATFSLRDPQRDRSN